MANITLRRSPDREGQLRVIRAMEILVKSMSAANKHRNRLQRKQGYPGIMLQRGQVWK